MDTMQDSKFILGEPGLVDWNILPQSLMVKPENSLRNVLFNKSSAYELNNIFPDYSISSFKNYKRKEGFIPVALFVKLLGYRNFKGCSMEFFELEVKKRLCGLPIPLHLPISRSEELAELIGHTLGDGHISKGGRFVYVNTCKSLIKRVQQLVDVVFGKSVYCDYRKRKDGSVSLHYPSALGLILERCGCVMGNKFRQEFDVPVWIKNGSEAVKSAFIRALFDDEGSVNDSGICINMAKIEHLEHSLMVFFESLQDMLVDLKIRPRNITRCVRRVNKNGTIAIGLLFVICGINELKNFREHIGFIHPEKEERLKTLVDSFIQPNYHDGEAKLLILDNLEGQMSTKEVSVILDRGIKNTRYHLNMLEKEGKIKKVVVHSSKLLWEKEEQSKRQDSIPIL